MIERAEEGQEDSRNYNTNFSHSLYREHLKAELSFALRRMFYRVRHRVLEKLVKSLLYVALAGGLIIILHALQPSW